MHSQTIRAVTAAMLVASLVPVYYQVQEAYLSHVVYRNYAVSPITSEEVALRDGFVRHLSDQVFVAGKPVSLPEGKYRQMAFLRLNDKRSGER
jgi:hypothetical protein